ncbi:MAG: hypothetical protein AABW57_01085 [Nanoarchaeota archaeon]
MKKAQVGIEFLYFVGAAITILIIYLALSSNYLSFTSSRKDMLSTQNLLEEIRNEVNLAGRVEDGYSRTIKLPVKINSEDYSMNIAVREIYITIKGKDYSRLLSTDVSNQPLTLIPGNSYTIKKENSQVTIT